MLTHSPPLVEADVERELDDQRHELFRNEVREFRQAAGATLDDLREAVTTLEETERTMRRVLGGAHPLTTGIEGSLQNARAALRAREAPPSSSGGA